MSNAGCALISCELSPVQHSASEAVLAVLSCSFGFALLHNIPVHEQMGLGDYHWWALWFLLLTHC